MAARNEKIHTSHDSYEHHDIMKHARMRFWDTETKEFVKTNMNGLIRIAKEHQTTLSIARKDMILNEAYTNVGTLHQKVCNFSALKQTDSTSAAILRDARQEHVGIRTQAQREGAREERGPDPDVQRLAETLEQMGREEALLHEPSRENRSTKGEACIVDSTNRIEKYVTEVSNVFFDWGEARRMKSEHWSDGPNRRYGDKGKNTNSSIDSNPEIKKPIDAIETFRGLYEKLNWYRIREDSNCRYGDLSKTAAAAAIVANAEVYSMPADSDSSDDDERSYAVTFNNHMSCLASLTSALDKVMKYEISDHRLLAMKIDLYDELKEKRFIQPSGVEWAWAAPNERPTRYMIPNNLFGEWHYDAVVISLDVLAWASRHKWRLLVGGQYGEEWLLTSGGVIVITVPFVSPSDRRGLDTWIVSHLTYPLVGMYDVYNMRQVGGTKKTTPVMFARTAGLVDLSSRASKIVFVVPNISTKMVTLGGRNYHITHLDRHGSLKSEVIAYDFDDSLVYIMDNLMLVDTLDQRTLRETFSEFVEVWFPDGIDWLEINSMTVAATVRFHQRIESYYDYNTSSKFSVGAPVSVLNAMGLTADAAITEDSYPSYGGLNSVNALDQRLANKSMACTYPCLTIGSWSNMTELALAINYATYSTYNEINKQQITARMRSGGIDRLTRGQYLRVGMERWKASQGWRDDIAFPQNSLDNSWRHEIFISKVDGVSISWFVTFFINEWFRGSWNINAALKTPGSTLTGKRTVSSMWQTIHNTTWTTFSFREREIQEKCIYLRETSSDAEYVLATDGLDDPELESVLTRLDMEQCLQQRWNISYKVYPCLSERKGCSWVVDSLHGGILAHDMGVSDISPILPAQVWGWGLAIRIKDIQSDKLYNLTIPISVATKLRAESFVPGIVLYKNDESFNRYFKLFPIRGMTFYPRKK